jgi:hypothetical protein
MFGFIKRIFAANTEDFGRSPKWRNVRNDFVKNNPRCAACGTRSDLEVHHIIPYHVDPSLELDPSNLITLCGKRCHFLFGHFCDWSSWNTKVVQDCNVYSIRRQNRPHKEKIHEEVSTDPDRPVFTDSIFNSAWWNHQK